LIRRQLAQAAALAAEEDGIPILGANAGVTQEATRDLLLKHGFRLAFTVVRMTADLSDHLPAATSLPDGVAVRPVQPDHYQQIHEFIELCFRENGFGFEPMTFDEFHRTEIEHKDLDLWHVAWQQGRIVALVISEIDDAGVSDTPWVAVHPDWRRRGLARTLLSDGLVQLSARGVRKATISTVAENQNDTLGLYRGAGFEVVRSDPRYRRPGEPLVAG
jgi:ribosomal-protein-alanine N-acetyltransferase